MDEYVGKRKCTATRGARLCSGYESAVSLNPFGALGAIFADLRLYETYGKFPWPGARIGYQFNIVFGVLFLLLDTAVITGVTLLIEYFLVARVGSLQSLVSWRHASRDATAARTCVSVALQCRSRRVGDTDLDALEAVKVNSDVESIRHDARAEVQVTELRKRWSGGDYAVDGVSFSAYPGEVSGAVRVASCPSVRRVCRCSACSATTAPASRRASRASLGKLALGGVVVIN